MMIKMTRKMIMGNNEKIKKEKRRKINTREGR